MEMLQGYRKVLNALWRFYTAKTILCAARVLLAVWMSSVSVQFSLVAQNAAL